MTKTNMDLSELLSKHDQGDFLRTIAVAVMQLIMETDVEGLIDAGRHERSSRVLDPKVAYSRVALQHFSKCSAELLQITSNIYSFEKPSNDRLVWR